MSVSHNFTTQDDQKRLEHSTDGTAALKDFAALPADERKALDGPTLLTQYKSADMTQRAFWRTYLADAMTYNAFHGRIWRAKNNRVGRPELYKWDIGKALEIETAGNHIVFGDVHAPLLDYDHVGLMLGVARKHLKKGKRVFICGGDVVNGSPFSRHPAVTTEPAWLTEKRAARAFWDEVLSEFDYGYWVLGNHDEWLIRYMNGMFDVSDLHALLGLDKRVIISPFDYMFANMPTGRWMVTHSTKYSKNPLVVANRLAMHYQAHVIQAHEHHLGMTTSDNGRYLLINNGGLFNVESMAYVRRKAAAMREMVFGFTLMRAGFPTVLGPEPYTNWDLWL